jgi:hypothetical protein
LQITKPATEAISKRNGRQLLSEPEFQAERMFDWIAFAILLTAVGMSS